MRSHDVRCARCCGAQRDQSSGWTGRFCCRDWINSTTRTLIHNVHAGHRSCACHTHELEIVVLILLMMIIIMIAIISVIMIILKPPWQCVAQRVGYAFVRGSCASIRYFPHHSESSERAAALRGVVHSPRAHVLLRAHRKDPTAINHGLITGTVRGYVAVRRA